jgi:hypothetical protein
MRVWIGVIVCALGCGEASPGSDGGVGGDGGVGSDAGRLCAAGDPIVEVAPVAGLNELSFQCCAVFPGGIAYFAAGLTEDTRTADIWRAERGAGGFGPATTFVGADTDDAVWRPVLSGDRLALYYNRAAGDRIRIHAALRRSDRDRFDPGRALELGAAPTASDADPFVTDEGLYFARGGDIHFAAGSGDSFGRAAPILAIASAARDDSPVVSADREVLYWASDRGNVDGASDVWMARRESAGLYGAPELVPGDLGEGSNAPSWESPDGCALYFTTTRTGQSEIWVGRRERPAFAP